MKTWIDKRDCEMSYKIKTIDKKFADITEGSKMFIATPLIIDEFVFDPRQLINESRSSRINVSLYNL